MHQFFERKEEFKSCKKYNFERFIFFMCSIFSLLSKLTIYWFSCLACPKLALVKKSDTEKKSFHDILHCKRRCLYQKYNVNDLCNCFCYFRHAHIHGQEVRKQSMTFQTMVKILLKYYFKGFFCFLDRCFFTLGQKSSIYPKIHIMKISFCTKYTF